MTGPPMTSHRLADLRAVKSVSTEEIYIVSFRRDRMLQGRNIDRFEISLIGCTFVIECDV